MARHFFTTDELRALAQRTALMKRTIEILNERLHREQRLRNLALHELAVATGHKDVPAFMRRWERQQLSEERQEIFQKMTPTTGAGAAGNTEEGAA